MGDVSIKMYDKFGRVLRIESTCNNIGEFRIEREVTHKDGTTSITKAPMKKTIYSLYRLFSVMKAANYRYLEFISSFDDHSGGHRKLAKVTKSVTENNRSYRGLNFFDERDLQVMSVLGRGEYSTFGLCNKDLREHLGKVTSSSVSRTLKRLKLHGLIKRVDKSYKYMLTKLGRTVVAAGLKIRNLVLIPELATG